MNKEFLKFCCLALFLIISGGFYATAPDQWKRLGRFGNYFIFKRVGLGVTNCDMERDDNANLTGSFDYFEITMP